jgi:hypothetical protein
VIAKTDFSFGEVQALVAKQHRDEEVTRLVDSTLEDSFPASDPPSWTASVARPAPAGRVLARSRDISADRRALQRAAALF